MLIEKIKLNEMKALEKNIRVHSERQIREYIKSIKQFGQTKPIILDDEYNILVGNGLHKALSEMGEQYGLAYIKKDLSEKDKKKLIIADNRVYELGLTHSNNLEDYIKDITDFGDFDIVGFDEDIIKSLIASPEEIIEDMQDYGIVDYTPPSSIIEKKQNHNENINQSNDINNNMNNNINNNIEEEISENIPNQEFGNKSLNISNAEKRIIQTIVCPNCAEVISID